MNNLYLFNIMQQKMHYLSQRQGLLAENIANADTPDYKAKDLGKVDFRSLIPAADPTASPGHRSANLSPVMTDPKHMRLGSGGGSFKSGTANNFERTPVGNEVSLDEQAYKMNETALDYQTTTGLYRKINEMMRAALGGSNS